MEQVMFADRSVASSPPPTNESSDRLALKPLGELFRGVPFKGGHSNNHYYRNHCPAQD